MTKINIRDLAKRSQANADEEKAVQHILISDKVDFKARCIKEDKEQIFSQ